MKTFILALSLACIVALGLWGTNSRAAAASTHSNPYEADALENLWNWREALEVRANPESEPTRTQIQAIDTCLEAMEMGKAKLNARVLKRLQFPPQHESETRAVLLKLWESVSNDKSGVHGRMIGLGIRKCFSELNSASEKSRGLQIGTPAKVSR